MSDEPTWRRPLGTAEQSFILERYVQLEAVWRLRWPDKAPPRLSGDALQQTRVVQLMAHRLHEEGIERPGLQRGPGVQVDDATLRRIREQQEKLHQAPATNGHDPEEP